MDVEYSMGGFDKLLKTIKKREFARNDDGTTKKTWKRQQSRRQIIYWLQSHNTFYNQRLK